MRVTPWETSGKIDYDKLFTEFGIKELKALPKEFQKETLFRRKKIFAHRDYKQVVDAIQEKKPFVMMTGLMPTGRFHIGHMIIARQMVWYQKMGAKIYIAIADIEAYNARGQSLEDSKRIALNEYVPAYISMGLKPEKCHIYFQSERSKDAKTANSYYRLQNLLARHATYNEFKAVYGEITPGKMMSALLQASDMLHPQIIEGKMPVVVPVGVDQDPHLRLARDMQKRIKAQKFLKLSSTYNKFMPGLDGGKMSASEPQSYIALEDSPDVVKKKINKYAFSGGQSTVEEHRKKGGDTGVDVCYQWLMFLEEDDAELESIKEAYECGRMLTGELKALTIEKINNILSGLRENRTRYKPEDFLD